LKNKTPFQMYTFLFLRDFPENLYLAVNSNALPTRLLLGKIAVEWRLVYFIAVYVCVCVCVCVCMYVYTSFVCTVFGLGDLLINSSY